MLDVTLGPCSLGGCTDEKISWSHALSDNTEYQAYSTVSNRLKIHSTTDFEALKFGTKHQGVRTIR